MGSKYYVPLFLIITAAALTSFAFAQEEEYDVIVVGAGMAGLGAASTLDENGMSVMVLEARDRIGGRLWTFDNPTVFPYPSDMGAAWIHGVEGNPLQEIVDDYKIKTTPTPVDPSDPDDRKQFKYYDSGGRVISDSRNDKMWERYGDFFDYMEEQRKNLSGWEDDVSVKSVKENFIKEHELSGNDEYDFSHTVNWWMDQEWATDESNLGLWLFDFGGEFPGEQVVFPGGYKQILQKFDNVNDKILYNHVVNKIISSENGVIVQTTNGKEFKTKHVIVTVPLGVLKSSLSGVHITGDIEFSPKLPDWKEEAIEQIGLGVYHKTYMVFPEHFWKNDTDSGYWWISHMSDGGTDWTTYVNLCKIVCDPPWLVALNSGAYAVYLETLTEREVANQAMRSLRTIYGSNIPDPVQVITTSWGSDPFAKGSYSNPGIGTDVIHYDNLAKPIGNVHFAGEATCTNYPSTIHGAYFSGVREANSILSIRSWEGDLCSMECSPQSEPIEGCQERTKDTYIPDKLPIMNIKDYLSPFKQMESGVVPSDVKCSANKQLLLKATSGDAVCVNKSSVEDLINKGFGVLP